MSSPFELSESEPVADWPGVLGWLVFASPSYPVFTENQVMCVHALPMCAETADMLSGYLKDAGALTCGSHLRGWEWCVQVEGRGLALRPEACFIACF